MLIILLLLIEKDYSFSLELFFGLVENQLNMNVRIDLDPILYDCLYVYP